MTFEEWYEENVEYMHIADFKPWLHEAFDAGIAHEREACASLMDQMAARDTVTNYYKVAANAIRTRSES
jgi:hypothetical protein